MVIGIASDPLWKRKYAALVQQNEAEKGEHAAPEPEFRLPPAVWGAWLVPIGLFGESRCFFYGSSDVPFFTSSSCKAKILHEHLMFFPYCLSWEPSAGLRVDVMVRDFADFGSPTLRCRIRLDYVFICECCTCLNCMARFVSHQLGVPM